MKKDTYIGALTNKPYAFKNRPWELNDVYSIDILDSLGSNIVLYLYGTEVRRILPLKNDIINEDWISNRSRYFFEGLLKWRLNIPLMQKNKFFLYISWFQSFYLFFLKIWFYSFFLKIKTIGLTLNSIIDMELIVTTKILMQLIGLNIIKNNNINYINDYYLYYINPFFFEDIYKKHIYIFLGINIRLEAPILNIKLRKNIFKENLIYSNIGNMFNDNLNSISLGLNIKNLINFLIGKLKFNINIMKYFRTTLNKANLKNFKDDYLILIGNNIILQKDNYNIYNMLIQKLKNYFSDKKIFNKKFLLKNNLKKKEKNKRNLLYNLKMNLNIIYLNLIYLLYDEFINKNIHEVNENQLKIIYIINGNYNIKKKNDKFIIYQGHLLDINIFNIDLILPNSTFLEKSNKYLNIAGNLLQTNKILTRPNYCRNDWMVLNAIYIYILNYSKKIFKLPIKNKKKNFLTANHYYIYINNNNKLYKYLKKYSMTYIFKEITKYSNYNNNLLNWITEKKKKIINKIFNKILNNYYYNIYNNNAMDRNSKTLKLTSYNYSQNMRNYANI